MKNKKILYISLGVGLVGAILFMANKKAKAKSSNSASGGGSNSGGSGSNAPVSKEEQLRVKKIANAIFDACNQCGTDEDVIFDNLAQLRGQADYDAVKKEFGTRKIFNTCWFMSAYSGDLEGVLKDELGSSALQKANDILSSKSIKPI